MSIKIGYKKAELTRLAARIAEQGATLVADLPAERLWNLHLTCCCDRCIDPDMLPVLCKTPAPELTDAMIGQYFGGVAAVETSQTDEARFEARVIMTHVLRQLGHATCLPREKARPYRIARCYFEADYLVPYLVKSGFIDHLPADVRAQIKAYMVNVVHYAAAKNVGGLDDTLSFLSVFTDALPEVLEAYRTGPPRRHLRFWTSVAAGAVTSGVNDRGCNGKDIHLFYRGMSLEDRDRFLAALEAPEVEQMMERYAYAAKDEAWLRYLSMLLQWRERTILATQHSEYRDGRL